MILFNQENGLFEEKLRPANHGPVLYFPKELSSIESIDTASLNKNVVKKLTTFFEIIKETEKRCFSAQEISELFNVQFNTARAFLHKLKNSNICQTASNFKHFNNSKNASLYLVNSKSTTYSKAVLKNGEMTTISNENRHLLITSDSNPLITPNLSVNDNGLLKAFFNSTQVPDHTRLSNILPISGIKFDNQSSFEVRHSETFSSRILAADPTTEIADIEHIRFLYLIINLTMSYFEYHKQAFILKNHVEAICSINRDQILTWLMVDKDSEHWKSFVDKNLAIWANTLFCCSELIESQWISEATKPLFRIEKKLAHRKSSKFPQVYVLRWDVDALKFILKSKGPYLLPWSVISGSDFSFLLYLDARLKWPGKKSTSQRISYSAKELKKIFPMVIGREQVPQSSEKFAHYIVTALHEHATRFKKFTKKNPSFSFKNEDVISFYDRNHNEVELLSVLKKKHYISQIKAYIGGIWFDFIMDGIGANKEAYLEVHYKSKNVIRSSLPARILPSIIDTDNECDSTKLKAKGYYSYSPQYYFSEELTLHADKLVNPGFNYNTTAGDQSLNNVPDDIVDIIADQYQNTDLGLAGPLLNEHAVDLPNFLDSDMPPILDPKIIRNVEARKFVIARFPSGKNVVIHYHIWITITKDEPKLLLSYYSTDDDINKTVDELVQRTGDFKDRILERIKASHSTLQPISVGEYLIDRVSMSNIKEALNTFLEDDLKLVSNDQLYTLITNNKRHIVRYSQSVSPIADPLGFASKFKHYIK
ncbi:hypothetical protein UA38_11635 [Photobacterium kishitanii]|uniref:Uncharacterized protein n=2 Tax=Photobacterium kishitanii TaxID=318456 RepID=A0AAX0YRH0_9GAMM|nr:hypothetical protein [Photobacterium kishitanii]KJG57022.1 hypothetical protein UA38_11635 [Photobacterium kishitanii]KJG60546.1 hypothetical protein UA42_14420 [Photobacterium kishitanii]KJG68484.1 hypothetical protein UA41_16525 [Photobacterium kishitanii]OBU31233.1 hypothetical protein AYY23_20180 [Photobacterium kishitanii]PSX18362.1 hypothetical protein C0W70_15955 [Photobacterium kishitanii]